MNWNQISDDNTSFISFDEETDEVKVLDVYDGDTVTIAKRMGENGPIYKFKCRLIGIDTPELRTRNAKEKALGIKARDFLKDLVLDKVVLAKFSCFDKYGRLLVWLYVENEDVASKLIEAGLAREYHGGKRLPWFQNQS